MTFKYNYYGVLGIANFASIEDVRRAYKKLALVNHPDRGGKTDIMALINDAYDVLTKRKAEYDMWLRIQTGEGIGDILSEIFGHAVRQQAQQWGFQYVYSWQPQTSSATGNTSNHI